MFACLRPQSLNPHLRLRTEEQSPGLHSSHQVADDCYQISALGTRTELELIEASPGLGIVVNVPAASWRGPDRARPPHRALS